MSGAPNSVTFLNNSGELLAACAVIHSAGIPVITGPATMDQCIVQGNVLPGAKLGPGTATVFDGLEDYWTIVVSFDGNPADYYIVPNTLSTTPYKECGTPDNGSTQVVLWSKNEAGVYPVVIETFEPGGSPDGKCTGELTLLAQFQIDYSAFISVINNILQGA